MKQLRTTLDFILYSNLFIGVCAVVLTFTNQLTVEGDIKFDTGCWFVLCSTIFTYCYLKFGIAETIPATTGHHHWATKYNQLSKNLLLLSLLATCCFFGLLNANTKIVVLILAGFTALYGFVDIPLTNPKRKLRDFGLLKTFFVATVWSVTTVIVPLENSFVEPSMLVFLLLRRFLFVLALTMVFEIKDMKGDAEYGLRTLPILFGVSTTKLIAQLTLFALIIINLVQYFFFDIALMNMLAVNLSVFISILCIQPLKEETPEVWYYLVLDGMMILQFVFVYIATKYLG